MDLFPVLNFVWRI